MVGFSALSVALTPLSVEEGLRPGGLGLRVAARAGVVSCLGVVWPDDAGCRFILLSDFMASLVENIRVSRFVIDGFSGAGVRRAFCGSAGGAAFPLLARLSTLGTAMPLTLTGKEFGELTVEDGCDAAGEGWAFSRISDSLGPLTEAMRMVGGGRTLGSSGKECAEEAAQAVRAMPVFLSNFGGQNCWCWGDCLAVGGRRFCEV